MLYCDLLGLRRGQQDRGTSAGQGDIRTSPMGMDPESGAPAKHSALCCSWHPDSPGSRAVLSTAVSVSLPGTGTRSRTVCTSSLPSGQRAPSPREVGAIGRCHQACQGGQAPVVVLGCSLVLPSPVQLQPLAVLTQTSDPIKSLQAGAGPGPSGVGCWGSPSSCTPSSRLPGSRRVKQARAHSQDCTRARAGLCVLGLWGEGEGWSQRLKPWDPPDLLLPRALGT